MVRNDSVGSKIFDVINYIFLAMFGLLTLIPFIYVLAVSVAPLSQVLKGGLILWPEEFTWDSYRLILDNDSFMRGIGVSIFLATVGTFINMLFTTTMAYPLSKSRLKGRKLILLMIIFTMVFNAGLIPTYLVVQGLNLNNTIWSLILPGAISAYNLIIIKNFFGAIPEELEQAALIDGCSNMGVFFRIILPLSKPALATFTLFYAVAQWNQFFGAVIYINNSKLWPIQLILRNMIIEGSTEAFQNALNSGEVSIVPTTLKMAAIIVSTLPIIVVYPFLQKHFAKGVLLGSVKG